MTMRFGVPQCIRCTMVGHLSYQCGKPILPVQPPPEPELVLLEEPREPDYDPYDDYLGTIC